MSHAAMPSSGIAKTRFRKRFCTFDVSSRAFVLGVGCRRGVEQELRLVAAERYLSEFGLNAENIASIEPAP